MASSKVSEIAATRSPGHCATVTFGCPCWAGDSLPESRSKMRIGQHLEEIPNCPPDNRRHLSHPRRNADHKAATVTLLDSSCQGFQSWLQPCDPPFDELQ